MRLTDTEIKAIEDSANLFFSPGTMIRLFGSRLDDHRRGGDIDLLIETSDVLAPDDLVDKRNRFLARLYRILGEQKIDVLIVPIKCHDERPIVYIAREKGIIITKIPME